MKIAIWTTSAPKIAAIEDAIKECIYFKWENVEIVYKNVNSEISEIPKNMEEIMEWAKNRAQNVAKHAKADFYLWMQWWTAIIWNKAFLFWVIYILNDQEKGYYWISNMMEVPSIIKEEIYNHWKDLCPVMSELTWEENAFKKNWAFGHWSDDMLTRKDQFMLAFLSAIPWFYNKYYKQ